MYFFHFICTFFTIFVFYFHLSCSYYFFIFPELTNHISEPKQWHELFFFPFFVSLSLCEITAPLWKLRGKKKAWGFASTRECRCLIWKMYRLIYRGPHNPYDLVTSKRRAYNTRTLIRQTLSEFVSILVSTKLREKSGTQYQAY